MLAVLVAAPALGSDKSCELARPKDFSRDYQAAAPPAAPNAVVLSESFTSGIPGTWQVIDNAGEGPVWTDLAGCGETGNFTNGTGDVACVSSDVFGQAGLDTELRTPVIDLSGYTAPASLTFTANYQNFANADFFQVGVSTDGGGSWTNLLSWNEDHGGFRATPGEDVNLDIGSYAGQPSVMFRFHYFDPNEGDWDLYVQVDDVVVNATVPTPEISLTKTVGTTPGVCAATNAIAVPAGTTVYYCDTVENTGSVTLGLHDLADDQPGAIFAGLILSLTPGSSFDTAANFSIPAVIDATTTNTATWTAYNAGPVDSAQSQASATVTVLQPANVFGTETVAGLFVPGGTITYTIVLSNTGAGAQGDNAGDEFSDTLPTSLTATGAAASSGTATRVGNLVTWNGSIPAGGSVTITITATVNAVTFGTTISNQGTVNYDATGGGTNGATRLTDDPAVAGDSNPTDFRVADPTAIPGLHPVGLAALALLTALAAALAVRRIA